MLEPRISVARAEFVVTDSFFATRSTLKKIISRSTEHHWWVPKRMKQLSGVDLKKVNSFEAWISSSRACDSKQLQRIASNCKHSWSASWVHAFLSVALAENLKYLSINCIWQIWKNMHFVIQNQFQVDFKPRCLIMILKNGCKIQLQFLTISDWKLSWLEVVNS